jgi:twinkle protein
MNISDISAMLANQAQSVAQYLLPEGKKISAEWCVGSIAGDPGKSLRVHLTGPKAGVWKDFSDDSKGGDLLDLWRETRGLQSNGEAMREAAEWLGVSLEGPKFEPKTTQSFQRPKVTAESLKPNGREFLSSRGLTAETAKLFRIGQQGDKILFPYFDDEGVLTLCKTRPISEKSFALTSAGCKPILFGWQAVIPSQRSIVITEGELDAMSVRQLGVSALSVPFGGGKGAKQAWIEHEFDRLQRFDCIFLAMDMDDVGKAAASEIAERLGIERCRIVGLPHKDPNACLMAGMTPEELIKVLAKAKTHDPSELKTVEDFREEIIASLDPNIPEVGFRTPWHDKNGEVRFRPGEVTVIAGASSHGKSEAVGFMAVDAISQGEKICVASLEAKPRAWIRNILFQTAGTTSPTNEYASACLDWIGHSLMVFDCVNTAKVDRLLEVFAYARRRYGTTFFIIDNMTTLNVGIDDYEGQRNLMSRLTDFAKHHDVHVFLVVHIGKGNGEDSPPGKNDIRGSTSISDLADTVLTWWRNRAKEQALRNPEVSEADRLKFERQGDVICSCVKQRATGKEPKVSLFWDASSHRFLPYPNWKQVEYVRFIRGVANSG